MITTDGRQFVYGVFGADGCECDSLEAIFTDEKSAVTYAQHLHDTYEETTYSFYGEPEYLEVRQIEIGKRIHALSHNVVWTAESAREREGK